MKRLLVALFVMLSLALPTSQVFATACGPNSDAACQGLNVGDACGTAGSGRTCAGIGTQNNCLCLATASVPAVSTIGAVTLVLALLVGGTAIIMRRRERSA